MVDWNAVLSSAATVAVALIGFLGVRYTTRASRKANAEEKVANAETARLGEAWPMLLDSVRTELVEPLREELDRERQARKALAKKVDEQGERISSLSSEVTRWRRTARALARWGMAMREQLRALDVAVPAAPDELELLHAIEDTRFEGS
ncbi:hypothetical protein [Nocardioides campestrisoli]|uniref:hypothetical protein n=1 Tax=Nocardioides campestrisoli TaxID=2736757 RepID=UPI0015E6DFFC|nr:hypothetical protein [Nocardioides campestrisoli]